MLKDIDRRYDGDIIVPMTLVMEESYTGDWQTIHDRILKRGEEEGCWCMENIGMCLEAQQNDSRAVHIYTVGKSPEEIVEEILAVE